MTTTTVALGPDWLDPLKIIESLGSFALVGILLIVFAECGLLAGFFFPGDSLLFVAGLLVAAGTLDTPLWLLCLLVTLAAVLGNLVGYWIGRKAGPPIFERGDSRLFKQEYVDKTFAFFDKYGARAVVLARFVPIVRTFITVMAGVGKMDFRRYAIYSTIGGIMWGTGVTVLGYFLGQVEFVADNIELIAIGIVFLSVLPIAFELLRERRRRRSDPRYDEAHEEERVHREEVADTD
ncbi:MAG: DedA family protein [Geodermatophilaceae bacterium]